jgi:hypothetical protein
LCVCRCGQCRCGSGCTAKGRSLQKRATIHMVYPPMELNAYNLSQGAGRSFQVGRRYKSLSNCGRPKTPCFAIIVRNPYQYCHLLALTRRTSRNLSKLRLRRRGDSPLVIRPERERGDRDQHAGPHDRLTGACDNSIYVSYVASQHLGAPRTPPSNATTIITPPPFSGCITIFAGSTLLQIVPSAREL